MYHTVTMSSKLIIFVAFLIAVTSSSEGKPYTGYPLPFYPNYTNGVSEVPPQTAPWHASLQWSIANHEYNHFCSGAILSTEWVITSAHCALIVPSYGTFVVFVGKTNLEITETNQQWSYVSKSIVHDSYRGDAGPNDIALLKLSKPLRLSSQVSAISLLKAGITPTGTATLTGWGTSWRTHSPVWPKRLQAMSVKMIDSRSCETAVKSLVVTSPLTSANVCSNLLYDFTSCNTDPGSPLVIKNGTVPTLAGIVSWGIVPCGTIGAPLIYTKISAYNNWIANTMRL